MMNHRLVTPFIMWAIVGLGFATVLGTVPNVTLFRPNALTIAILALTIINWLYLFTGAIAQNRTAARSAAAVSQLATSGVYAKVRHPIYSADIVLAWGVFLNVPTLRALACVVWMTMVLITWMKVEERALEQRFGQAYSDYRRRTPMIIPKYL